MKSTILFPEMAMLVQTQKLSHANKSNAEKWSEVADIIWAHLEYPQNKFDDQLLCSICFYSVLPLTQKQDCYFDKIEELLKQDLDKHCENQIRHVIAVIYGIFQSSILLKHQESEQIYVILSQCFNILVPLGYDYAWYTFIVFKIMNSFMKVIGTNFKDQIFNKSNQLVLLHLTIHNWENPITGVRDLNKTIFRTVLTILDKEVHDEIVIEIDGFYWNKAKYLMLSEVIALETTKSMSALLTDHKPWVLGLISSLHKPGLVSAGADMYFEVLKHVTSETEWSFIFMEGIIEILNGTTEKSIENFTNYWCLATLKKFPNLMEQILEELNADNSLYLYSSMSIMKQGNKLGIFLKKWDSPRCQQVVKGLSSNHSNIRMLAFDIVCISQYKIMPNEIEFNLVYEYMLNNVNSDSTNLRINMLGSLKFFLIRTHMSFLNNIKKQNEYICEDLKIFCDKVQKLLEESLEINGNYQRKITTIKLCDTILTNFADVPKKKQQQARSTSKSLLDTLKERGIWILGEKAFFGRLLGCLNDPAEDVRESVAQIMFRHYFQQLKNPMHLNILITMALQCMPSKFFYETNCSHNMFKLIVNVLIKENQKDAIFESAEDIFKYCCKELNAEFQHKRDILDSIEKGKQLHSYISIQRAVFEVTLQNSYELQHIRMTQIVELLEILEGISTQFASQEESTTSSDFANMNDRVQNIIDKSGHGDTTVSDKSKISGLHQIILNSMWLNVKECCELSALLIKAYSQDADVEIVRKCLGIITNVLATSRHKGAIESAGAALGESIKYVTKLPEESALSKLPRQLLEVKLEELIKETGKMSSITRRGAGLSIMVHRIVANDMKKGKPLFHYFMKIILDICKTTEDIPMQLKTYKDIDNEKDLPKAIYIHFLTRIVTDSSLASDVMYYSSSLGELAFQNLTSDCWQIRNAALQLYGALVPKLIGQKKSSGPNEESAITVASDELRTHLPSLWIYVQKQLSITDTIDKVQTHSNLVPILNLLGSSARRYNFKHDLIQTQESYTEMFHNLINLLDSPIYTVRRLSAQSIYNNYDFSFVWAEIKKNKPKCENSLHGHLLLLKYYREEINQNEFTEFKDIYNKLCHTKIISYESKLIFEDIYFEIPSALIDTFHKVQDDKYAPGIHAWANKRCQNYIKYSSWDDILTNIEVILQQKDLELYFNFIDEKIKDNNIPSGIAQSLSEILLQCPRKYEISNLWKLLYKISPIIKLNKYHADNIAKYLETNNLKCMYKLRYMICFIANAIGTLSEDVIEQLANIVLELTDSDFEMRYIAVLTNNAFAEHLPNLSDDIKITVIKSAVILLQDEDEDIRNLSVQFLRYEFAEDLPHAYLCLSKMLDYEFLSKIFVSLRLSIQTLCNELKVMSEKLSKRSHEFDEYNPFSNDSKNIYFEADIIKKLLIKLDLKAKGH